MVHQLVNDHNVNDRTDFGPPVGNTPGNLGRLLKQYRLANNTRNLWHLGLDLLSAAALVVATIWLCENYQRLGLHPGICIPIVAVAVVLIGAVQHRLAGLGHEGSHHVLFRNPWMNELAADWLCMFPLFTTTDHYRSLHLGHHRWVNDDERDPEFHNLGCVRKRHTFPMRRWQFVTHFMSRILWPISLLQYSWANMVHGTIGITQRGAKDWPIVRPMFLAGVAHFTGTTVCLRLFAQGSPGVILLVMIGAIALAAAVILLTPERFFYRSGYPGCYGPRLRSWFRLCFLTILQGALVMGTTVTAVDCVWYFRILWILPLLTGFPYFMLLRDAYQHANTDEGRFTNSRVMFPDPFSGWAIFMYGSDIHLTHHLHPGVPHYKLRRLHESLKRRSSEYAEQVVETHGMFARSSPDYPCLIETIEGCPNQSEGSPR